MPYPKAVNEAQLLYNIYFQRYIHHIAKQSALTGGSRVWISIRRSFVKIDSKFATPHDLYDLGRHKKAACLNRVLEHELSVSSRIFPDPPRGLEISASYFMKLRYITGYTMDEMLQVIDGYRQFRLKLQQMGAPSIEHLELYIRFSIDRKLLRPGLLHVPRYCEEEAIDSIIDYAIDHGNYEILLPRQRFELGIQWNFWTHPSIYPQSLIFLFQIWIRGCRLSLGETPQPVLEIVKNPVFRQ